MSFESCLSMLGLLKRPLGRILILKAKTSQIGSLRVRQKIAELMSLERLDEQESQRRHPVDHRAAVTLPESARTGRGVGLSPAIDRLLLERSGHHLVGSTQHQGRR